MVKIIKYYNKYRQYQALYILIISVILILHIGHCIRFFEHFTQQTLCLQGKYNASLSLSKHIIHTSCLIIRDLSFSDWYVICFLHI